MSYSVPAGDHYWQEDGYGTTIAVAVLLRGDGKRLLSEGLTTELVSRLEEALLQIFGGDDKTPIGIAIRATERMDKRIAADLALDAAVACPDQFQRSLEARRTVADFKKPRGGITN